MPNPVINRRTGGGGPTPGSDWANLVVANGGAFPSQTTINAYNSLYSGIVAAGLRGKIYHMNGIAPDSIIAAKTPFIHDYGFKLWVEHTTGASVTDLTINGIKPPSSTSVYWDTGFQPGATPMTSGSGHIGAYIFTSPGSDVNLDIGYYNSAATVTYALTTGNVGFIVAEIYDQTASSAFVSSLPVSGWNGLGYVMDSRVSTTAQNIYGANSGSPHQSVASNTSATVGSPQNQSCYVFAAHATDTSQGGASTKRYSFFTFGEGLTAAESSAYFNLQQAFRVAVGGGSV